MKNLYKLLFCLLCFNAYSQNDLQNANWCFTDFSINFQTNPPDIDDYVMNMNSTSFGAISNHQGNLIFSTNGMNVWDVNNDLLFSNLSHSIFCEYSQNLVIIPDPSDSDQFYIFSMDCGQIDSGPNMDGLRYSRINLRTNNIIDDNIQLLIGNGKLTSARHINDSDYWLIVETQNEVVTFLINNLGPVLNNSIASPLALNRYIQPAPLQNSSSNGFLKISNDQNRIMLGYSIALTPDLSNERGAIFIGLFDNSNGNIIFEELDTDGMNTSLGILSGGEFSPNGENVFLAWENNFVIIIEIDIVLDDEIELVIIKTTEIITQEDVRVLQLSIDGNIYFLGSDNGVFLRRIINTDNFNPIVDNFQHFSGISSLPQWVYFHTCLPNLISNIAINDDRFEERLDFIESRDIIGGGSRVIYHAGNHIDLLPDFETLDLAEFAAYIEDCTGDFIYRQSTFSGSVKNNKVENIVVNQDIITIYPNPSYGIYEFNSTIALENILLYTQDGKLVYQNSINNRFNYSIDISNYSSGLYFVQIIDKNGKIHNRKIIKK